MVFLRPLAARMTFARLPTASPRRPAAPTATHYGWLAFGTLVLTIYGSVIPLQFEPRPLDEAATAFREMVYIPPSLLEARGDWVVSFVLFLILSFLTTAALAIDHPWSIGVGAAILVVPACVVLSLVIEFVQVYFPPRTVSLNDVLVESLGGVAGAGIWLAGGQRLTDWLRRVASTQDLDRLAARLLPGFLVLVFALELMPFDLILSPSELVVKFQEGKVHLVPFNLLGMGPEAFFAKVATISACFLPLGFLRALIPARAAGGRPSWVGVAWFGLGVSATVEFLKLFVYSRYCDVTDVVLGTAMVLAGWRLGQAWQTHGLPALAWAVAPSAAARNRWFLALLAWLVLVLAVNWWPFQFTTDAERFTMDSEDLPLLGLRRMALAPFVDYYWGSKYQALNQFAIKALLFFPLGAWLAFRPGGERGGPWQAVGIALAVASLVQLGRYFLPARFPSMTDALIESGAAGAGFLLGRHWRRLLENNWALPRSARGFGC
jgi:VanZ family protein